MYVWMWIKYMWRWIKFDLVPRNIPDLSRRPDLFQNGDHRLPEAVFPHVRGQFPQVLTEILLDPVMSGECDNEHDDGSQDGDIGRGNPFCSVFLSLAVRHTIQKSVYLLNKGWSYQSNAPRLDSRLHCRSFDTSYCHDPNRNFTHLEHCKGGINIRIAGTEAPPARCGCGALLASTQTVSIRRHMHTYA